MKTIKIVKLIFSLCIFIVFFAGCISSKPATSKALSQTTNSNLEYRDYEQNQKLYKQLLAHYKKWKGTPYKYGGNSKRGVDCSAYVQNAYRNALNIKIPRTTKLQSQVGQEISMVDLQIGDLIFFKTGYKTRHVGIYIGGGDFIHASTSKGVTISNLSNQYYINQLWKIQRVLD